MAYDRREIDARPEVTRAHVEDAHRGDDGRDAVLAHLPGPSALRMRRSTIVFSRESSSIV